MWQRLTVRQPPAHAHSAVSTPKFTSLASGSPSPADFYHYASLISTLIIHILLVYYIENTARSETCPTKLSSLHDALVKRHFQ